MASRAAPFSRSSATMALVAMRDGDTRSTDGTRGTVAARDSNDCRVAHRQDARSIAVIAVAETWAFGRGRRAASGEGDATSTTCRTTLLYIDCAGFDLASLT